MTVRQLKIAENALLSCMTDVGIAAGYHHFVDLWARDSLFASFGANAIGKYELTRKTIETFLRFQRKDGLIPYCVMRSSTSLGKYVGKPTLLKIPRASFRSRQSGGLVLDGGLMTIVAMAEYIRVSGDENFLLKHYQSLVRATDWYYTKFGEKLLSEWFQCEWMDAVLKSGKFLLTNVMYWKALSDMAELATRVDQLKEAKKFQERANTVCRLIQQAFWNGTYFSDWIDYKRQDYFHAGANMLAVIFGIAGEKQSALILAFAKKHCWNKFTLESNYPKYPWWRIPIQNYVLGMSDYWNRGMLWLQTGILFAVALKTAGKKDEAKKILQAVENKIIEHNEVYEVYEKFGKPVKRLFYISEGSFAWSAGLFLYAKKQIFDTLKE